MQVSWRLEPGGLVGEVYRLESSLGLSEVGECFRALDVRDQSIVRLTSLHPQLFQGKARGPNTLRVQRSRAYAHAHVVAVRDIVLSGEHFYVVTEPIEGRALEHWVLGRLPLAHSEIVALVEQIVEALECVHLIGVHGNLRPANIYVDDKGGVTLSEPWFLEGTEGVEAGALLDRQGHWTAPEQRSGNWQERHESDVFLLGALVAWMIAGRAVIPGLSLLEQKVEIPPEVDALLLRAMAAEPEERFEDVQTFWASLKACWNALEEGPPGDVEASEGDKSEGKIALTPLEVVPEEAILDEVGDEDAERTEAIPLSELERMGLDVGIDANTSHVDAIVILDADEDHEDILDASELEELEAIPLVTDTSYIPFDQLPADAEVVEAIVEVGIIDRGEPELALDVSEERTIQVVPGPGSARALEAARRAESLRKEESEPSSNTLMSPKETLAPPQRVRTRAVYVAPFLALLAGSAMFWVLGEAMDEAPKGGVESSKTPAVASGMASKEEAKARVGQEPRAPIEPSLAVAEQVDGADAAQAGVVSADSDASEVTKEAASLAKGDVLVLASQEGDAQVENDSGPQALEVSSEEQKTPTLADFEDMEAADYRCPSGMAKIRSRRKVTLPDGTTKRRKVVWCTDRYEFPGKGALPTTNVTLAAAKTTCRSRGRRLCRRREWRGACGGSKYPYRGDYEASRCNTVAPGGMPRAVVASGSKRGCKGGFGTYDMTGNVAEWTSDGSVNGGSAYKDGKSATCYRSSRRTGGSPYVGFRCCADPLLVDSKKSTEGESP